jgi:hypothetical protein
MPFMLSICIVLQEREFLYVSQRHVYRHASIKCCSACISVQEQEERLQVFMPETDGKIFCIGVLGSFVELQLLSAPLTS